jgi:hypothetical protein
MSLFKFNSKREYVEERIDLNIRGRITVKCNANEFILDNIPIDKYFVKVKVFGTKRDIKNLIESKKYRDAISKGIIFQFLEIPSVEINQESIIVDRKEYGIKFSDRVKEMLLEIDTEFKDTFYELFKMV